MTSITQGPTPTSVLTATIATTTAEVCTTAVPGKYGRVPTDACNSNYGFDPSFPINLTFAVLFGIVACTHLFQAFHYKKVFAWTVVMGCFWEVSAFAHRTAGAHDQQNRELAITGMLLFILAPLWLNAFCFMSLARLIYFVVPDQSVFRIKASRMTKTFVWLDIISFFIQSAGGAMMAQDDEGNGDIIKNGQYIYMGGVGFQLAFIIAFLTIIVKFFLMMKWDLAMNHLNAKRIRTSVLALTFALLLIVVRIAFRLVEFAWGANEDNPILRKEWYVLGLDALPMLIAFFALCVVHPGQALQGPGTEFPKLTRAEKKIKKMEKMGKRKADKMRDSSKQPEGRAGD